MKQTFSRRSFIQAATITAGSLALGSKMAYSAESQSIKLGFDNFSIRACGWKAPQLIEYAASLKVDILMLSDLEVYESFDADYLRKIKELAESRQLQLHAGTGSICPTSSSYNEKKWGPAEDHAKLLLRVAKEIGAPIARCYMGTNNDRKGDGGIYRHIEEMVKVCQAVKSYAQDAEIKIAIENHAGDMQAWELAELIEATGKDTVGCTIDCGNAAWTLEDPMVNLDILGPYALSSGMRDNSIWETEMGAKVMWSNMGAGNIDWSTYMERYKELCPKCPFILEILSYTWERDLPYLTPEFWSVYPKVRAHEFARFIAWAKKGSRHTIPADRPTHDNPTQSTPEQQKYDLVQSLAFCKNELGLGTK
jgi:sugar phosphate isomerase/epimerase